MDLYEYQGRALFARHGLPVPDGAVATTQAEALAIAERLGGPVVVKAQVKTGGRGKAGGVRLAGDPQQAAEYAAAILGMDINGHRVDSVMLTTAAEIVEEYYLSYLLDRTNRSFTCMASVAGGMEIEQVAVERPESLVRIQIDPAVGVDQQVATRVVTEAGFPTEIADQVVAIAIGLWKVFVAEDATLVEVNPLARVADGTVQCLDAKVTLDDNARFRHDDRKDMADSLAGDPLERRAQAKGLNYVKLDGQVGVIGNGAGLVMSTLDVVAYAGSEYGARPANFLDIGGGASAKVMADGLEIILSDPDVRSVLVNVFGGITACDAVATGIVQAIEILEAKGEPLNKPLVVRLDGNNAELGRQILLAADNPLVERVDAMDEAAKRAAQLATAPAMPVGAGQRQQATSKAGV